MPSFDQISGFFNLSALRLKFFDSGPIPYAITLTFLIGTQYLWQIFWRILRPVSTFLNRANIEDLLSVRRVARGNDLDNLKKLLNASSIRDQLRKRGRKHVGYYAMRFSILLKRWERDKDIGAVSSLKNEILDSDEEDIAIAFTGISWVEWTLPLLGFLGTVVGIGGAISSVQNGVSMLFAHQKLEPEVLKLFNDGFKGLALAFDTTFQGLAFLIIIGGLHFLLRRSLAASLAEARLELAEFVAKWAGSGGAPSIVNVHNLDLQMTSLELRLEELHEAVRTSDSRSAEFREDVRNMVEHVVRESPNLEWVRKVLFAPVVEFNPVWLSLARQAVRTINTTVGHDNWKFAALGVSPFGSHGFVAAIENRAESDSHYLFFSNLDAETQGLDAQSIGEIIPNKLRLRGVFPSSDFKTLLAVTQDGQLTLISTRTPLEENLLMIQLQVEDAIFPLVINEVNLSLITRRTPTGFEVTCLDFASVSEPERIYHLSGSTNRALWAFHSQSAKIVVAIQGERNWRLHFLQFSPPLPKPRPSETPHQPQPKLVCQHNVRELLPGLTPKQILALSSDETLIVDEESRLHYWDKTRSVPIQLRHASWPLDPKSRLLMGANGWIAVSAHDHLTMWRIQRGGHLYPYETLPSGFSIDGVDTNSFVTTWDGRYILAIGEQLISPWEFPRYAVDGLK